MSTGYNVGVIGGGFVGSAVAFGFGSSNSYDFEVKVYDLDPNKSTHSFEETVTQSDFIFMCLPTPSREDMSIDLSYIEKSMEQVSKLVDPFEQTVVIKSTVIPGTCRRLSKKYGLNIVSNPEFLTERRAKWDFINAAQVVIGSDEKDAGSKVRSLYQKRFSSMKYLVTDSTTAEFVKYMLNCFFSVKLSFMNEMYQVGQSFGVDWGDAVTGLVSDSRVGDSHVTVPGPDGKFGFGGHCFPKDINAMIRFAERLGVDTKVLKAAWDKNLDIREENLR
jgi:UDPglucose 6-dehydrogenase|tara:strand:+ start:280 stop:1107 length:828 start_codon:yes stop_codon:yes gene_type:complete